MSDRYRQACEAYDRPPADPVTVVEHLSCLAVVVVGVPAAPFVVIVGRKSGCGPSDFSRHLSPQQARLFAVALQEAADVAEGGAAA